MDNDYYKNFIRNVNQVTSEDIIKVSNEYFNTNQGAIIIAGKGLELIDKLENLSYNEKKLNINYYDTAGNLIDKPDYSFDESVSVESVINNYIDKIGGRDRLETVESIEITEETSHAVMSSLKVVLFLKALNIPVTAETFQSLM